MSLDKYFDNHNIIIDSPSSYSASSGFGLHSEREVIVASDSTIRMTSAVAALNLPETTSSPDYAILATQGSGTTGVLLGADSSFLDLSADNLQNITHNSFNASIRLLGTGEINFKTTVTNGGDYQFMWPSGTPNEEFVFSVHDSSTTYASNDAAFRIKGSGQVFLGNDLDVNGSIDCEAITCTSIDVDGGSGSLDLTDITVNNLVVEDTVQIPVGPLANGLIRMGDGADSSDGYESIRAFSPFEFWTDRDNLDIEHSVPEGRVNIVANPTGSVDEIPLVMDITNAWASGANATEGYYLTSMLVYLRRSEETTSTGLTSHSDNTTAVRVRVRKKDIIDNSSSTIKEVKFTNGELAADNQAHVIDITTCNNNQRTVKFGDLIWVEVKLYTLEVGGVSKTGPRFYGMLIGAKELLLHP